MEESYKFILCTYLQGFRALKLLKHEKNGVKHDEFNVKCLLHLKYFGQRPTKALPLVQK